MADESYPTDRKYFKEHDWVRVEGDEAVFGITWFAQDSLGEIVYVDLPDAGTAVASGETYGELESVKAVSEVYAPITGEISAVNDLLVDSPDLINKDPYGDGWLIRVRMSDAAEVDALMDAPAYQAMLAEA